MSDSCSTKERRAAYWCGSRPALMAAVLYGAFALVFVGQALTPGRVLSASDLLWTTPPWAASAPHGVRALGSNPELADSVTQFQPFLKYTRSVLPHAPLWNPYIMSGRPLLANAQSAVFSPFSLPAYVLPFWRSFALVAALKLFVAALGTFLLGRALGMRLVGGLLAGLVYGFGLFFVAWLTWPQTNVWAWIPWLLLLTDLVVRRHGALPLIGLAAVVSLQFLGGHPESSFAALTAALAFLALRVVQTLDGGRARAGALLRFAGALVLGTALAAVAIIPFVELLDRSSDISSSASFASTQHVAPHYLLAVVLPDYWGRPTHETTILHDATISGAQPFVAYGFYPGALTLMLAGGALLVRPTVERIAVAAFGVASMLLVLGVEPFFSAVRRLPGIGHVRLDRLTILFLLCVALLAGWGLDELAARRRIAGGRRRVFLAFVGGLLAFPVAWMLLKGRLTLDDLGSALGRAWLFTVPHAARAHGHVHSAVLHLGALLEWVVFAGAGAALIALYLRGRMRPTLFAGLALLLVAGDLAKAGIGLNPAIPRADATQPRTGAIRYLQRQRPARFVALASLTPALVPTFAPNVAMDYGLFDARGYDLPVVGRYTRFWKHNIAEVGLQPRLVTVPATARAIHALSVLSVADLLQGPSGPPVHAPGVRLAYQGSDARVYTNASALPRAFLVTCEQVVDSANRALEAISAPQFDGRSIAVVERRVSHLADGPVNRCAPTGRARLVTYAAQRVVVHADTDRSALLVLTDTYYPGWKATVDGKPAVIHRVDYLVRGVTIPPGSHRVEFRYQPTSWRGAWIISILALLALLTIALVSWRRGRHEHRRGRAPTATSANGPESPVAVLEPRAGAGLRAHDR